MASGNEIVQRGMVAVRNSATLYPQYQELFNEAFGYFPECPTCGSALGKNQWKAFEAFVKGADPNTLLTSKTSEIMSKNTFKIKDKTKLYSYNFKKKGQDRDFTARTYGDVMTEDFALAYLDAAKDDADLLAERKAQFILLPSKYAGDDVVSGDADSDLSKLKLVELQALASKKSYPANEWEKINSKANMIAYLEAKAIPEDSDSAKKGDKGSEDDSLF